MDKIAIQVLCGANEEPFLKYAIESVHWADYFTVVNTAPESTFGKINKQIVEDTITEIGGELRYAELYPFSSGLFSFSDARNKCLSMTDPDDFVFIVDADDVHFPQWERELKYHLYDEGADSVTAHYYHLTLYKDIFHFSAPREIVYRNYEGTTWAKGVHEQLINEKRWPVISTYHYMHYGYIKPQTQVFDRWKFYSDIDGDFHHYDGQDPKNIISDRISVCKPLPVEHPPIIQNFLESYPSCPQGALRDSSETVPIEKIGLVLLTYNDEENLLNCLESLSRTGYPKFEVLAIDLGSTDNSVGLLDRFRNLIDMQVYQVDGLISLTESLNFGFNHFRQRHDIQYIGWIHPDMIFHDQGWLEGLWRELQDHPKIGKICAANTKCPLPEKLAPGNEQCYIMRKDIVNKIGLFDEKYIGIGGYEDWDFNKRILNHDGYKIMMSPKARVLHEGMGTRSKRDTSADQIHNAKYYFEKWHTQECPV